MRELIVDSFAGGGGASLGISAAVGREVDIAINHDQHALAMHAANHPHTRHVCEDVWHADLRSLVGGRPVGLLWASPDCKHFSRAKGSVPVNKQIRSLAWVAVRWASQVRPRIICLENVREFADWGPLVPRLECDECGWHGTEGQAVLLRKRRRCPRCEAIGLRETADLVPDPDKRGMTFRLFVNRLRGLGYHVEWRNLNAADYGAPTHRRRLFLIARRDGQPIIWPEPTHGDPRKLDAQPLFSRLLPWRTAAECIDWSLPCPSIFDRKKPLAEKTLRRIAEGIKRYVLESAEPFIVGVGGRAGQTPPTATSSPVGTITRKNDRAVVMPYLIGIGGAEYSAKPKNIDEPATTVLPHDRRAVVAPCIVPITHQGQRRSHEACEPLPTITSAHRGEHALISTALIQMGYGEREGQAPRVLDVRSPLGTVVAGGVKHGLIVSNLIRFNHDDAGVPLDQPLPTVTQSNHAALVYSFLVKYFGTAIGAEVSDPMPTVTSKDRFGLVTVTIAGELYAIVDIGMRMLTPRELARAQGFADDYLLTGTKTNQVARIGNSVCPPIAQAIVAANFTDHAMRLAS